MPVINVVNHPDYQPTNLLDLFCVLDSPITSIVDDLGTIDISGWVVSKNEIKEIYIEVSGEKVDLYALNIDRPDVRERLKLRENIQVQGRCGFSYKTELNKALDITLLVGNKRIPWKRIKLIELDQSLVIALDNLFKTTSSEVQKLAASLLREISTDELNELVTLKYGKSRIINILDIDKLRLQEVDNSYFKAFATQISSPQILQQMIESAVSNNTIEICNPFGPDLAICQYGFYDQDVNYLVFSGNSELFCIVQYLHTVDCVYFPERDLILTVENGYFDFEHVKKLLSRILIDSCEFLDIVSTKSKKTFLGLVLNGISPYHFFYDVLPALEIINSSGTLRKVNQILSIRGNSFYSSRILYELDKDEIEVDLVDLKCDLSKNNGFYIVAGSSYKNVKLSDLQSLDDRIAASSKTNASADAKKDLDLIQGSSPIVWVGISGQKRTWVNQTEVLTSLICMLAERFPDLAVAFDGMTSSIFDKDLNSKFITQDYDLVREITESIPKNVKFINLVGRTSIDKIYVANHVDFFISNYSTGSMYPARFQHKPGIAHLSNALMNQVNDIHIHYETTSIPSEHIEDIPDPQNPRVDFVSYRISKEVMLDEVNKFIDKYKDTIFHRSKDLGVCELKPEVFNNIIVTPYEELLQESSGLSVHKGGPHWTNWELQKGPRHWRSGKRVDHPPTHVDHYTELDIKGAWCGAICHHFGHQISEFSMRIAATLKYDPNIPLFFGVKFNSRIKTLSQTPLFFREILDFFAVNPSQVYIVCEPVKVKELIVFPQAEHLHGPSPTSEYLNLLSSWQRHNAQSTLTSKKIYVSRSKLKSGIIAGEKYLEHFLKCSGYEIFHPENFTLKEQLAKYACANHIIFSEGSAIHAIQLLGCAIQRISILLRRKGGSSWADFVRPRSIIYEEIDCIDTVLMNKNAFGIPMEASGITLLDPQKIKAWLCKLEDDSSSNWSEDSYELAREFDAEQWINEEATRLISASDSKALIIDSLSKSGMPQLAAIAEERLPDSKPISNEALGYYKRALAYSSVGDFAAAIDVLNLAISEDQSVRGFYRLLAEWQDKSNNLDAAISTLRTAILLFNNPFIKLDLSVFLLRCEQYIEAGSLINAAIKSAPYISGFYVVYAEISEKLNDTAQAINALTEALRLSPNDAQIMSKLADLLSKQGNHNLAIQTIERAIQINGKVAHYYRQGSVYFDRSGRLAEALEFANKFIELSPNNPNGKAHLSNVLFKAGQINQAIVAIDEAIKMNSKAPNYYVQRSKFLESAGYKAEALESLKLALELSPDDQSIKVKIIQFTENAQ